MAHTISLEPSELRAIITGKAQYRRCPDCEGTGEVWCAEYTLKNSPLISDFKNLSSQQAADFSLDDWPDWDWAEILTDECENCNTVGYVCSAMD